MEPGIKEIQNLKNTCYINSVIQMIAHVQPLKNHLCHEIEPFSIPEEF